MPPIQQLIDILTRRVANPAPAGPPASNPTLYGRGYTAREASRARGQRGAGVPVGRAATSRPAGATLGPIAPHVPTDEQIARRAYHRAHRAADQARRRAKRERDRAAREAATS